MSLNLRTISPSGAAYRHVSGVWGRPAVGEWLPLGTGANGAVVDLCEYNGGLIVVGSFTSIGGVTTTGVGFWDGSWHDVGGGIDSSLQSATCCAVYGGSLYVGGVFTSIGGTSASRIARFDGTDWHAVGSGLDDAPYRMIVFDGKLIVCGQFFNAGGSFAFAVAAWNGSSWSDYSTNNGMIPLTDFTLYGSTIAMSGGAGAGHMTQVWSGTQWDEIGSLAGSGGQYGIQEYASELYVAGDMGSITPPPETVSVGSLAKYASGTWSAVGSFNNAANCLTVWDSKLIIGGAFTNVGPAVAQYNGTSVTGMGAGFNSTVYKLGKYGSLLVAVGFFTASGSTSINRVGYWSVPE